MSDYGRFAFEPLLNLVNGRPVGMEVRRCQARDQIEVVASQSVWGTRQLAEFDSGIAIASVLYGTEYDATVPLHVDVLADTVVAARRRVAQVRTSLRNRVEFTPPIMLEINPALSAAPPRALYATRPAIALAEEPRTILATADLHSALKFCLSGDRSRSYDDLVLLDAGRVCIGIVRVTDLL